MLAFTRTLRLSVTSVSGETKDVEVNACDTPRSLIVHAGMQMPDRARAVFYLQTHALHPDLSLACQGVVDGAVIHVMFVRIAVQRPHKGTSTSHEMLRLADASFLPGEMARSPRRMVRLFRSVAAGRQAVPTNAYGATKIVTAVDVCEEPLPSPWADTE
jgi:hypothetical protein